jgi:HEAT repeat protein
LQSDPEREVAVASQSALAALEGPGVDDALVGLLGQGEVPVQRAVIDLIGRRRVHRAVPQLLALAREGDPSLRTDAIQVLGDLAGSEDLPALIDFLREVSVPGERRAAEDALTALCVRLSRPDPANVTIRKAVYGDLPDGPSRDVTAEVAAMVKNGTYSVQASNGSFGDSAPGIPKKMMLEYSVHGQVMSETVAENQAVEIQAGAAPPAVSDALCAALSRASGESTLSFLRVLRSAGGEKALAAVRNAMDDTDPNVRGTAASVLSGWPTVDAFPELLTLAAAATTDTRTRILALRGAYRLIPLQTIPDVRKLAQVKRALDVSTRPDEKRLALSALARIALPESLAVVVPHLQDAAIAEEAGLAAVAIAEKLATSFPAQATDAARQVLEVVQTPQTRKRAQALLNPAQPADP